ncbi:uncharacterized protein TNCV_1989291 [Trichonephila clavipes]|nr:uncharacterized protein TNCV_1989291 [Trichonephila clavipes]
MASVSSLPPTSLDGQERGTIPSQIKRFSLRFLVKRLMHIKSIKAQSPPVGLVRKFEGEAVPAQILSSSLDHGSKLRDRSSVDVLLLRSPTTPRTKQNVSSSEQEEDERGPMLTSAIKDLLKMWEAVRAMVLEWHPNQADVSRVGELNNNAINYFRKILKKREKQSTLDMFFNAP